MASVRLKLEGPYDLPLSVRLAAKWSGRRDESPERLRRAVRIDNAPAVLEVRQVSRRSAEVEARADGVRSRKAVEAKTRWTIRADTDLKPFYRAVRDDPVLGPLVRRFRGLKPFRPDSLFEMAVLAVTEQQISTKAAHSIQKRLLERFGREVDGLPLFPSAETLAEASSESLRDIGLSGRKTEYIQGLARQTASGEFDLQALCGLGNDEVRRRISGLRGFGRWSADYILVRGLGRPDVVPADDLGVQKIVGAYFAGGARLTARQVTETLAPYRPWRGLAVFYLAADHIRKED